MAKRASHEPSADQQQPYDNLLKSLFEGQEKQLLPYFLPGAEYLTTLNVEVIRPPLRVDRVYKVKYKGMQGVNAPLLHKAIDEMVKYYKGNEAKLAEELRWMGIALRKVKTLPRTEKREIQERLNMWDDLMERDPKMKKIRKESKAQGIAEGKAQGVAEGLAKGKTQGLAEGLQTAVITAIKLRFPPLTELAQQKVSQVQKPETLNLLLDKVTTVPDEDTVRLLLDFIAA